MVIALLFLAASNMKIVVGTTADTNDGACSALDVCSLREAVAVAPSGGTIVLPALTIKLADEIVLNRPVTIVGKDARLSTITAPSGSRVFAVQAAVELQDLTLRTGHAPNGGLISNAGDLLITRCSLESGTADSGGGAIYNTPAATLTIRESALFGHDATKGGVIFNAGDVQLENCSIVSNQAGGIASSQGSVNIISSSIAGAGVGLRVTGGSAHLDHSVIATTTDCIGSITANRSHLTAPSGCTFPTGVTSGDVLFDFEYKGGPTQTLSPTTSSALLIDKGDKTCPLPTDQRGSFRPARGPSSAFGAIALCDIGAFESVSPAVQTTQTFSPSIVPVDGTSTLTLTVSNAKTSPGFATGLILGNTLPSGATVESVTPSQGSCSRSGRQLSCDLGAIAPAASAHVDVVLSFPAVGSFSNSWESLLSNEKDTSLIAPTQSAATVVPVVGWQLATASALEASNVPVATLVSKGGAVSVTVTSVNGSALAGSDFTAVATTLVVNGSQTLSLPIIDDEDVEDDETFLLVLTTASGAVIDKGILTVTIGANDLPSLAPAPIPSQLSEDPLVSDDPPQAVDNAAATPDADGTLSPALSARLNRGCSATPGAPLWPLALLALAWRARYRCACRRPRPSSTSQRARSSWHAGLRAPATLRTTKTAAPCARVRTGSSNRTHSLRAYGDRLRGHSQADRSTCRQIWC